MTLYTVHVGGGPAIADIDVPAALRLHRAHGGKCLRNDVPHSRAMGYLLEAVPRRNGSDLHRFEEDI